MTRWIIIAMAILLASGSVSAQLLYGVSNSSSGGGTPIPPVGCTATGNVDLSAGCTLTVAIGIGP